MNHLGGALPLVWRGRTVVVCWGDTVEIALGAAGESALNRARVWPYLASTTDGSLIRYLPRWTPL